MNLHASVLQLQLKNAFQLSNSVSHIRENVLVRAGQGFGEAALPPYYKDRVADVLGYVDEVKPSIAKLQSAHDFETCLGRLSWTSPAARSALDMALHDHWAKSLRIPVFELLGLRAPQERETSFTIAIDEPSVMVLRAQQSSFQILKIKVGTSQDIQIVKAIRDKSHTRLRLDANGGWSRETALNIIKSLEEFNIELIEQPLSPQDYDGFRWLKERVSIPLYADESFQSLEDLKKLQDGATGVVVKVMKAGGLRNALRQIQVAKSLGFQVMLSCMIESSLGVTAAMHLSSLADQIDLDSPLLISNDPFEGVEYSDGKIRLASIGSGLGANPRSKTSL